VRKIVRWALAGTIFYFWINAMANNPEKIEAFRQQMNSFVSKSFEAIKRLAADVQ